jgi:hypothetical protein
MLSLQFRLSSSDFRAFPRQARSPDIDYFFCPVIFDWPRVKHIFIGWHGFSGVSVLSSGCPVVDISAAPSSSFSQQST